MNTQTQTLNSNIIVGEYGTYDMAEYSPDIKKFEWTKAYVKGKYYYSVDLRRRNPFCLVSMKMSMVVM